MRCFSLLAGLSMLTMLSSPAFSQAETGQIAGTVFDPSGAVVPNAALTVKSVETGATRRSKTSGAGEYIVTNLLPGNYVVSAVAGGFAEVQERVTVTVGAKIGADLRLMLSTDATVVTVSESAVQVNTETQTLATTVHKSELRQLPTLTRNPYDLAAVSGNVSDGATDGRGVNLAVNGQRGTSTNVLLDGAANNNEFSATVGQGVPLDSIQEFSLLTNTFTAEYGRASGAVVNVVTLSGTNNVHGTAYEFNRVSGLASNSFNNNANGIPQSVYDRNQFGYSLGGPLKKDKLFAFSSVEWTRVRSDAENIVFVPDAQLIAASSPNTQQFFQTFGKLAPGATILQKYSINQLAANGANLCGTGSKAAPLCASLDPTMPVYDKVGYSAPGDAGGGSPQNSVNSVERLDYNISDKTQIYGRYAVEGVDLFAGSVSTSPYAGFNTGETDLNNNILVSAIHTFSPRWISQSKLVFNRLTAVQPFGQYPAVPTLYTTSQGSGALLGNSVIYPGYEPYAPGGSVPFGGPQNFLQAYHDVSYTRGRHSFRFGGSYEYLRDNRTYGAYENGGEYLGTNLGTAVDGLVSGQLHGFQVAVDPQGKLPGQTAALPLGAPNFSRSNRYNEGALYAQDAWKLTSRVTLNLGLRWEYYGVQHNKNALLDSNFYEPSNEIGTPQGIRDGQIQLAPQSPIGGLWAPDYHDFAPRVGFAWDVFGDGSTALRGGYGIGYERNFGNVTYNVAQNPPNYETVSVTSAQYSLPISTNNLGPFSGTSGNLTLPLASLKAPIQNLTTAYAHLWSASVEHKFSNQLMVAADYSGSKGVNLYDLTSANRFGYGNDFLGIPCTAAAGNCTATLNPQYSSIAFRGNNGFSDYNALTVRTVVENLRSSGLHLNFNYTWSHAIDNISSVFPDFPANGAAGAPNWFYYNIGMLDAFAPQLDKGNADFDIRQRVVVSAVWDVPMFKHGSGWKQRLLGGWSTAPIFTARTGSPYSIFDCGNAFNVCPMAAFTSPVPVSANSNPQPNGAPNSFDFLQIPATSIDHFVNPQYLYSDLPPFPSDLSSRNAFRAPGTWNMNLGVYKTVTLSERISVQLRGEAYNLFNHANLYVQAAGADVSGTNTITACKGCSLTYADVRNLQLAAKVIF